MNFIDSEIEDIGELDINRGSYITALRASTYGLRRLKAGDVGTTFIVQARDFQLFFTSESLARAAANALVVNGHDYIVVLQVVQLTKRRRALTEASSPAGVIEGEEAGA